MGFTNPYPASRLTVDSTNSLVTGLAAWFPLTEGEGTSAQCILHPSHVGTLVGGTNAGWANTDIGTAFDSNGSNSTGIDIPNSVVYSSPVSYSFWVYDAAGTGTRFVFDSDDVTDRQFAYINNSNNFAVGAGVCEKVSTRIKLPDGKTAFEKQINNDPEKYYTQEVLDKIDEFTRKEFRYDN